MKYKAFRTVTKEMLAEIYPREVFGCPHQDQPIKIQQTEIMQSVGLRNKNIYESPELLK